MAAITTLKCAGESHTGRIRTNNEDRLHFDPERGIFIVVDGVGGQAAGEVAADTAVRVLRTRLERPDKPVRERILEAVTLANNEIFRLAETREEWAGMGCVLTLAVVENGVATIGHVGDTRLYKIRAARIQKVTRDHSPVGVLEDAGEMSEIEAMSHPRRNEVLRDVGSAEHTPDDEEFIDIYEVPFEPDSALLLCSDGLSDLVPAEQMLRAIVQHVGNRSRTVRQLIELANEAGGKDNVTVVFVEGEQFAVATRRQLLGLDDGDDVQPQQPSPSSPSGHAAPLPSSPATPMRAGTATHAPSSATHVGGLFAGRFAFLLYGLLAGLAVALLLLLLLYWRGWPERPASIFTPSPGETQQQPQTLGAGRARVHFVSDSAALAAALQKAQPDETIIVAPGRYPGPFHLKSGVALVSLVPRAAIIVPGDVPSYAIAAENVQGARLVGFLVDGERRLEVGVQLDGSTIELEDMEVTGTTRAGVQMVGGQSHLRANHIHDNAGNGVSIIDAATPDIRHNAFANNGVAGQLDIELDGRAQANIVGNSFDDRRNNVGPARPGRTDRLMQQNYFPGAP